MFLRQKQRKFGDAKISNYTGSRKYHHPLVFWPLPDVSKVLHEKKKLDVSGYRV